MPTADQASRMGQALYRKYRSKSLAEIVGQPHITTTLHNALKQGRISHAYLFTGPRGVGKTSIARILAHEVNGLPYDEDRMHLDIIEIDAASNRGIEEIRELRDKIHNAPSSAKYKVYIIDEVHMLTKQAFNALLKTLEEPPAHVIFILATTESHKLPETIISRTQRFTFKPIEHGAVVAHLRTIADQEGISVTDQALELIAAHGEGSFRDSISLLDQAGSGAKKITAETVTSMLGVPSATAIGKLADTLETGSPRDLLRTLHEMHDQGIQAAVVARLLGIRLRRQLVEGELRDPAGPVTQLLHQLLAVPPAHDPESMLEITLLGFMLSDRPPETNAGESRHNRPVKKASPVSQQKQAPVDAEAEPVQAEKHAPRTKAAASPAAAGTITDVWPQVLTTVKQRHNTLYGILRMAQPSLDGDSLTLAFAFAFHQKKMNEDKSKALLREVMADLMGADVAVTCTVEKSAVPPKLTVLPAPDPLAHKRSDASLDAIASVFGGAEVLES